MRVKHRQQRRARGSIHASVGTDATQAGHAQFHRASNPTFEKSRGVERVPRATFRRFVETVAAVKAAETRARARRRRLRLRLRSYVVRDAF